MPTTKAANYSEEQMTTMEQEYTAATNAEERAAVVASIAERFKKSPRSIISKMSREGFYIKKVAVSTVTGGKAAKKDVMAQELVDVSGLALVSAEKLNKTDLALLITHFESLVEVETVVEFDEDEIPQA